MSGHGSWSGQDEREQREAGGASATDGGGSVADIGESAYTNGDLDSVYARFDEYRDGWVYNARAAEERFSERNAGSRVMSDGFSAEAHADIAKATDSILSDFPVLKSLGGTVSLGDPPSESYAGGAWSYCGNVLNGGNYKIEVNSERYKNASLEKFIEGFSTNYGGLHFPNNTAGAVAAHELAHAIDARLTYLQSGSGWDGHNSWNNGTVAKTVLTRAAKRVGLTSERHPSVDSLVKLAKENISGYAGTDIHEALAEGFGQFYALGNNASDFSRAIYDEARKLARGMM